MATTPIKINRNSGRANEPTRNILNLNGPPAKNPPNRSLKKYLWLLLFLVFAEGALIAWLYSSKPASPYLKLLPSNAIASSYFSQGALVDFLITQKNAGANWPLMIWAEERLREFKQQLKVNQLEQLLDLFSDQIALAILPETTANNPTWLILGSVKAPVDVFSSSRDQIEQSLKQNYNLTSAPYRQIKTSQVQSLKDTKLSIFYAQANGFFILTNNEGLLKETLDKIIK